ncbi:MAG: hypothetical protein J5I53_10970 [Bradyrhizobiaceae bacterium]|nr:hypothetical protein [Bradyrhizobiaceae bacterium]
MVAAGIDIGTNTILMVIAEIDQWGRITVLEDLHEIPRLGEGLHELGGITREAVERASTVLTSFRHVLHRYGNPPITAVATEAIRRASNADKVRKQLEHQLSAPIHVLSGQQEAMLTFTGTTAGVFGPTTVIDIGGGSTELVHGSDGRPVWANSLPLGSILLTDQFVQERPVSFESHGRIIESIDAAVLACAVPQSVRSSGTLLAVAGTATSLAVLNAHLPVFDAKQVDGQVLPIDQVAYWKNELLGMDTAQLRALQGIDPRRADILPVGVTILHRIMELLDFSNVAISVRGLRYGALLNGLGKG